MISIERCDNCKERHHKPHGSCPIWLEIQSGIDLINKALVKVYKDKEERILSVVDCDHWLAKCDFECEFYNPNEIN